MYSRFHFLSITKVMSIIIICQKYPHCFQQRDKTPNLCIQMVKEQYSFVHFKGNFKDKDKEFLFPMQQSGSLSPLLQRQDRGQ